MHRVGFLVGATIALAMVAVPQSAEAADTTTTFTVTAGALTITAPANAALGSGNPGTSIVGSLGAVTVDDLRGANPSAWTATVSSTDFSDGVGVPDIPATAVTYDPGTATTTGDGTFTPGAAGTLSATPRTAYSHAAGTGSNSAVWNPTLTVAVPTTATAATYTGTVTHSVVAA